LANSTATNLRIVDQKGQSATAEGLFYQLIGVCTIIRSAREYTTAFIGSAGWCWTMITTAVLLLNIS